jgi:hypothetical protein
MDLANRIHRIGQDMVNCQENCEGIARDLSRGILPRCLFLEMQGSDLSKGTVIVGINPGQSDDEERAFYRQHGRAYVQVVKFWGTIKESNQYYAKLRNLARGFDLRGSILWTELVKCENAEKGKLPPLQTFRVCTRSFLNEELAAIPNDWPLIGIGREAYKALAYLYPNRTVIGVPHPTGSFGNFNELFEDNKVREGKLKDVCRVSIEKSGQAIWLSDCLC